MLTLSLAKFSLPMMRNFPSVLILMTTWALKTCFEA